MSGSYPGRRYRPPIRRKPYRARRFRALEHFAPFHHADVDLDPDLGQVRLHHLRAKHRVKVGRAATVAGEQGERRPFRYAGFLERGRGPCPDRGPGSSGCGCNPAGVSGYGLTAAVALPLPNRALT